MSSSQTQNYVLGRGRLYFDQFAPGTKTLTGERYFGSTPSFSLSVSSEVLDHYSMEEGIRTKDDQVTLEVTRTAAFSTDNVSPENVAHFILGDASALTVAGGSVTDEQINNVSVDRYYQVGYDAATNITGARNITSVTVTDDSATPVSFVEDTDYTIDLDLGRLYIIDGGSITDGTNLLVSYTEDAYTRDQVLSSREGQVEGAVRFIAYNAAGEQKDYYIPYAKITPNGDQTLKSDEWQSLSFNVEALELNATTPAVLVDGRPYTV